METDALNRSPETVPVPGPVPYTVLIAPNGKVIYRKHDAIDAAKLRKAIVEHLGRTYARR